MSRLTLTLFGSPHLARDGVPIGQRSRKCLALLAYLATTDASHRRDRLTALLWPQSDTTRAQNSLRHALSLLRRQLAGAWLASDREMVGLDGHHRSSVDVVRFRDLLARCRAHPHDAGVACTECLGLLAEAVDLYQGDFMAGFTLPDSAEFDDWQSFQSEELRRELAGALEQLAEGHAAHGDLARALAYGRRWVELSPLAEGAHRCLMRLYATGGQRSDALRQYEACVEVLESELGIAPSAETTALCDAIRRGQLDPPAPQGPSPGEGQVRTRHNLPPQPTPFVGRTAQLAQISQLMADPACRLLTLVGPGGIGKTRLAIQAAQEQAEAFRDGVCFVPLGPVGSLELVAPAIIEALQIPRSPGLSPEEQLLNALQDRQMLLLLDNFEHLLEGSELLSDMLGAAPELKMLVTSRQRLNLRTEWLLPLGGLPFPREEEMPDPLEEDYEALQLFVQCARRVQPDFSLMRAGASSVARICRSAEGMPLAIELAAPWVRLMSCDSIAQEIAQGLELLATTLRDVPQRHRSMRAVFDRSWGLLSGEQRAAMRALSVFRGGFRREAAEAVAGASLATLSALVDASWLSATPTGRYEIHELIRQYCTEQLYGGPLSSDRDGEWARDRHSTYFAGFLGEREQRLFGWGQKEAFQEILAEMDNVWAAWQWALEREDVQAIGQFVRPLEEVAELRGWHHEVHQALQQAATLIRRRLEGAAGPGDAHLAEARILLAEILRSQALEAFKLGDIQSSRALCEEGLALLWDSYGSAHLATVARLTTALGSALWSLGEGLHSYELLGTGRALSEEVGDSRWTVASLMMMAAYPHHTGRYEEAVDYLRQATAVAHATGDLRYEAWCLSNLSELLRTTGEYDDAREAAQEALRVRQEIDDRPGTANSLLALARIDIDVGDYQWARAQYGHSLALAQEAGDPHHQSASCNGLGAAACGLEQYAEARHWYAEGLALASRMAEGRSVYSLVGLGQATHALGELEPSREYFHRALDVALRVDRLLEAMDALVGLGELLVTTGEPQRAAELLALARDHPATTWATRRRTGDLLARLESRLGGDLFTAAVARGRARPLEEVVAELLTGPHASGVVQRDGSCDG